MADGLAAFANWCASNGIAPEMVDDGVVRRFLVWLETRTLCPKPRDLVRRVPNLWNEASSLVEAWPKTNLITVSFRPPPKRRRWEALSLGFRTDAEVYLRLRAEPDLFDKDPGAPTRPLASSTLRLKREHLRVAASVLIENGMPVETLTSLADLVAIDQFKTVLRYYHEKAKGKPNGWLDSLTRTLIQVARYHVRVAEGELAELRRIASKLPAIPFDLTPKNKALIRQLESERIRAKLICLPGDLNEHVARELEKGRLHFVDAQVAVAIDIALIAPLRPENLATLNWRRHFSEPEGSKGRLLLRIPAAETKTRKRELTFEIPDDVARRLRWYRRHILPRLNADPNGDLFVTEGGNMKSQETLSQQLTDTIGRHVGIRMSPHQFRHVAAFFYLEEHPEDFETVRSLLGHAWGKTTLIYAGSSSRRASRAYGNHIVEQREALKFKRKRRLVRSAK